MSQTPSDKLRPSTQAELELLRASRAKPQLELALTPDGSTTAAVHSELRNKNERRMGWLEDHLAAMRGKAAFDQWRANHKDRARSSFDRER